MAEPSRVDSTAGMPNTYNGSIRNAYTINPSPFLLTSTMNESFHWTVVNALWRRQQHVLPIWCANITREEFEEEKAASDRCDVCSEAVVVHCPPIRKKKKKKSRNWWKVTRIALEHGNNLTSNQCANNGFIASSRCDIQKRYKSSQNDNKHQQPRVILVFPVKVESCPSCQKPKTVRCVNSSSTTVSTNDERIP